MRNKKKYSLNKFILLTFLLIISRCFDFFTTYWYTPDLSKETNILVNLLNINYFSAGIIQLLALSLVIYLLYNYCFRGVYTEGISQETTVKEFIGIYHFRDKEGWKKLLYKLPSNKNSSLYSLGYILTRSLITIGFIVGTSTLLLIISDKYKNLYKYGGSNILYFLIVIVILFFTYKFYKTELKRRR